MIEKALFQKSPNLGIFSSSNNEVTLVPPTTTSQFKEKIRNTLETEILETTISNSTLIGIFTTMNDQKILVPPTVTEREKENLEPYFNEVMEIKSKYTAIGNLVSMNNEKIAASNLIKSDKLDIENFEIAGLNLIGSCLFVTNDGFLAHREASKKELKEIETIFEVEGDVGTVNFGDPYVKTGIIGNDEGILVGQETTGPELNRIDEVFMLK